MPNWLRETHTESAGTAIVEVIPAIDGMIPRMTNFRYTNGVTAHTVTFMKAIGQTVTTAQSLAAISTLTLADVQPGNTVAAQPVGETLAAADYLAWIDEDGVYHVDTVSSISGSVVTMTNAVGTDVPTGAKVWAFYELARATHVQMTLTASVDTDLDILIQGGYPRQSGIGSSRSGAGDPLVISINNITNAGTLRYAAGIWTDAANVVAG